ncbi:MAG: GNAT family N-acetyltransferase [Vampirovibrionales bacterium]|jgi:GNAT superfamily N-acetyltransferase|nr:GNAT family N-acetyltransferase [Vampirovibrionales bacterium]
MSLQTSKTELKSLKTSPELLPVVDTLFISFKDHLEMQFGLSPNFYTGSFVEEIDKYVQKPHADVLVLFEDETPVGCVAYHPFQAGKAEIKRLYVLPSTQGKGYGRYLMDTVIQAIRSEQIYDAVWLDTDDRLGLNNFYRKLKFQPILPYHPDANEGNEMLYFELKL